MKYRTAECVSPMHPDKICDRIADALLDAYLAQDPESRIALEVMGGHGSLIINGEVTSTAQVDIEKVARTYIDKDTTIISHIVPQSTEIARGVDDGGAGDQGIMVGYATAETPELLPLEYVLARSLCQAVYEVYPYDGKTQVTIIDGRVATVVVSFQNAPHDALYALVRNHIDADEYIINPAGDWSLGGFDADTGLSGRKIVVDHYGPHIPVGGGSFSGKDYTKVDRSGAYMARRIACDLLEQHHAQEVYVYLVYAIGKKDPIMARAIIDGTECAITGYHLAPRDIAQSLSLKTCSFLETASWGHFGRGFQWDAPQHS
ncbi:MAG: methionine adenosyltransferase domain-containing protein [Candidatus Pacebacteria bacterium]|nr:methionine adenosyltransferase domain-containing protein [Candidatus Paceibacterota bacterium]MCD8527753.1 methionine adenosyltransferase domain-containing protein [Candidatus Paceibacterota bacterium]MCD8563707.1 methionine adenosyltransferase domain-containing protein [Candidatus Paceibacterota bacterium]